MTREYQHFDHSTNTLYIKRVQDCEAILEDNAVLRNSGINGYSESRNWRKIASIPLTVVEKVWREKGINLSENSPEAQKYLREFIQKNYKLMTVDKL